MKNHDESDSDQRARFDSLITGSNSDDTVCDKHRRQLRDQALRAFDSAQGQSNVVQPITPVSAFGNRNLVRTIGVIAVIAVCLVVMAAHRFSGHGDSVVVETELPTELTTTEVAAIDSTLISSIAAATAFRDSVSVEAIYDALAMCQQADEARRTELQATQLLLYESTVPVPSLELPKG